MVPKPGIRKRNKERQSSPFREKNTDKSESMHHTEQMDNQDCPMNIKPPKPLTVTSGSEMAKKWNLWRKQFNWYSTAINLKNKSIEKQIATFMSVIGEDAIELYESFDIDEQSTNLENIISKFDSYFEKKSNIIYERFVFNNLNQDKYETFNDFLTKVSNQANKCSYESMKDILIRDRLVCGISHDSTRQKLFHEQDLTLEKTVNICKSSEAIEAQLSAMTEKKNCTVYGIKPKQQNTVSKNLEDNTFNCSRCGSRHGPRSCPAFQKKCSTCGITGHFSKVCRSKPRKDVKSLTAEGPDEQGQVYTLQTSSDQVLFIGSLSNETNQRSADWIEHLILPQSQNVPFKLDTGAQCNVISKSIASKSGLEIINSKIKHLISYTNNKLPVIGECTATVETTNKQCHKVSFIVVNDDYPAILGRDSCQQLGFIKRINEVQTNDYDENIFNGIGCLKDYQYDIDIVDNPSLKIFPARRVPYAIRDDVKRELDSMVELGVIKPVTEPTPVVSPMVIVRQKDKIRICLDPTDLNKNIKRRHHPLQTLEEIAARLNGSKFFTLLDCRKGFWQIKVTERTSKYLTFSTPWGRYSYLRMPFGIASAPEIFQERMCSILTGLDGVEVSMDDVLIHGPTNEILEERTSKALFALSSAGLKLNKDKCIFRAKEIKFLGHLVTGDGLLPDPSKVEAIKNLKTPTNVAELHRYLGMVTYLGKFIPNLSKLSEPLRKLLNKEVAWVWDVDQQTAYDQLKEALLTSPVLRYYDPKLPVTLSVDASSHSVASVLLQDNQPVAYSSKSLNKTQQNYSQLEKEALAISIACQKFHEYVWGSLGLIIETDHKPLESIFKKPLHDTPPRLRRIIMEVMPYQPRIIYKKGTELYIADTLSRDVKNEMPTKEEELSFSVDLVVAMSNERLKEAQLFTDEEAELSKLKDVILNGWPKEKSNLPQELQKYWNYRDELAVHENVIFKGQRMLIPMRLRPLTLHHIHLGHRGVQASLNIAREYVFWPNMTYEIKSYVMNCKLCSRFQKDNVEEELLQQEVPTRPWMEIGTDICHLLGKDYLLVADSYSGFYDIAELKSSTSASVILELKKWFSVHGIPDTLLSDGGTQFNSFEFKNFEEQWQFNKRVSSPLFARSNGLAERYVQEAKQVLKKCLEEKTDIQLALLHQRNIPRDDLGSPAQRLMGRRTKTLLPSTNELLQPQTIQNVSQKLQIIRDATRNFSNKTKRKISDFQEGEKILYRKETRDWQPATVVRKGPEPRSYIIETPDGTRYRRNSWFLKKLSDVNHRQPQIVTEATLCNQHQRKSSRNVKPPVRLNL